MKLPTISGRRPSPAIVISSAALFLSLGGVGYAATALPANSVGNRQIQNDAVNYQKILPSSVGVKRLVNGGVVSSKIANNAVTNTKIAPGSVGYVRADLNQLQARIIPTCGAGTAIGAISNRGTPTCNTTAPAEFGAADATTALTSGTASTVASKALPAGPDYLTLANDEVAVTSGSAAQTVTMACTLSVGASTVTANTTVTTDGTTGDVAYASLPLQLASPAGTATVSCTPTIPAGATGTKASVVAGLNAIQTSSNN